MTRGRRAGMRMAALTRRVAAALGACALGASALASPPPSGSDSPEVRAILVTADGAGAHVVVNADRPLTHRVFTLARQGDRVVVDLPRVRFAVDGAAGPTGQETLAGAGPVAQVRFAHFSEDTSRIVFDLNAPVRVTRSDDAAAPGVGLALRLDPVDRAAFENAAGFPLPERGGAEPAAKLRTTAARTRPVVVLDPGHGGHDPGAIGAGGLMEKTVNLAVALQARALLEARGAYDVRLTRDGDDFITLEDRVRFARDAGADVFMSIHADSSGASAQTRGASVYTLKDAALPRARREILSDANWLIDVDLAGREAAVSAILIDLAQRRTHDASSDLADSALARLRAVAPMLRRSHREAGYYVLLAPDVPAVLIELGFLSNADDEALLADPAHQAKLAGAIAAAAADVLPSARRRMFAARAGAASAGQGPAGR